MQTRVETVVEADRIDDIGLSIHPVLLGAGIPLFHPMGRHIDLALRACRAFQNGCVHALYAVYQVLHADGGQRR